MFVADTNVISLSDPFKSARRERNVNLDAGAVFLTTITVAEVLSGVHRLERAGATRKSAELAGWWASIVSAYEDRILPFDMEAATVAGLLADLAEASGQNPGWADIQIAAIATSRGFTVLTRNARHFAPLGVAHLDPFADELPD